MSIAAPMSKLEAVNEMLSDIGERPVNVLAGSTRLDVQRAESTLDRVSRSIQGRGWWFNTDLITVTVDGSGYYTIPANYTHVEVLDGGPVQASPAEPPFLVIRSGRLYDANNATDVFTGEPEVDLRGHRLLPYESLPSSAREYIYTVATIRFQSRAFGSQAVDQELRAQAAIALAALNEEALDIQNLDSSFSQHFVNLMHNR